MSIRETISSILSRSITEVYGDLRKKRYPRLRRYEGTLHQVLDCMIAYNEHGGFCIPLSSFRNTAPQAVLRGKVYERATIEFIVSKLGRGDMIHAGAFFGDFLPAVSRANSNHKIWAFEPNPESYRCAEITKLINELDNVELLNTGLGEYPSIQKMKIINNTGRAMGGGSRIASKARTYQEHNLIDVSIAAIDDVIPDDRKVDVIHLDVEGYEKEALSGAMKTIRRCKPTLIIETLPDSEWLQDNLINDGYTTRATKINNNTIFDPPETR